MQPKNHSCGWWGSLILYIYKGCFVVGIDVFTSLFLGDCEKPESFCRLVKPPFCFFNGKLKLMLTLFISYKITPTICPLHYYLLFLFSCFRFCYSVLESLLTSITYVSMNNTCLKSCYLKFTYIKHWLHVHFPIS